MISIELASRGMVGNDNTFGHILKLNYNSMYDSLRERAPCDSH